MEKSRLEKEIIFLKKKSNILKKNVLNAENLKREVTVSELLNYLYEIKKEIGGSFNQWDTVEHIRYIGR